MIYLFISCFIISLILIFLIQYLFLVKEIFDDINNRSSHNSLATRTGGIAIFSTLFIISVYFYFQGIEIFDYSLLIPLGLLFFLGVYDDLYQVDFKVKFFMQVIIGKILIDQGLVFTSLYGFLGIYDIPWVISQIITVLFFVTCVNAYNFIDGVDGLAISETFKNLIFFIAFLPVTDKLVTLCKLTLLIILPLYYFNFKKNKKVFLGDAGSLLLGGINMVMILHILNPETTVSFNYLNRLLVIFALLFYPLFDLFRVIIIRLKNNYSPFRADQNHIHHWLLQKGFNHIQTTLIISSIGAIFLLFIIVIS